MVQYIYKKAGGTILKYISTRSDEAVSAEEALLLGLAKDGGLYLPDQLPKPFIDFDQIKDFSYAELATFILAPFLPDIPVEDLRSLVQKAYEDTFDTDEIVPVKRITEAFSVAEMFHGRTCAFKDLALSLFPYLLVWAKGKNKKIKKVLILTATSGDTGKAALEGFRDVPGVDIMVFYPSEGVSPLQKDQMQKQVGHNVSVVGIDGHFDDAQSALKEIFNSSLRSEMEEKGIYFSSANSINIGRLLPQIVYYAWIWLKAVKNHSIEKNEPFNVVVPTGNFGNILSAWLAKQIGVPVGKLICASNENKILADFFATGVYDMHRPFHVTESPSMDILISSNFERFLSYVVCDKKQIVKDMKDLKETGVYSISPEALKRAIGEITGEWASPNEMEEAIRRMYDDYDYLIDPHTAVAYAVYHKLRRRGEIPRHTHTVIIATAHPYKFPFAMAEALGMKSEGTPYDVLRQLEKETNVAIPSALGALEEKEKRFTKTISKDEVESVVEFYAKQLLER